MSEFARVAAGVYLMYLRKSRQDDPNETIEEVLSKHETMLQEFMKREYGFTISEENIYREVCSGESIQERIEIKKILARIEDSNVKGVVVIEPQRLSRGDLVDCGNLINDLRYTHTLVVTPMMTYDLENKMERKFFQDELLRGRDYLEYTKEILFRGRVASVKRGCYIGRSAPYGYDKVTIGKDHTLEPNEKADIVRLIYDWYVNEGLTYYQICCRLNDMGVPAPLGGIWKKDTPRVILHNLHYDGKVYFNKVKSTTIVENGEKSTKRLAQPIEEVIIAEGKHKAIIDHETFIKAQERSAKNPPFKKTSVLKNPLAGIVRCATCGKSLINHPYKHAEHRLECRERRPKHGRSVKYKDVESAVITALEFVELPKLEVKLKNGDGDALKIKKSLLDKLEKQLAEFKLQEEKQYEFLETGRYTEDVFDKRNTTLRDKMEACQQQIKETKASMPKSVDYGEKIISLKKAIESLKDDKISALEKNKLLKAVVEKINLSSWGDKSKRNGVEMKIDIIMKV